MTMLSLAFLLPSLALALPSLIPRQATCAPLHIIAVRGSTEDPGPGTTIGPLIPEIQQQVQGTDSEALDYPATIIDPFYTDSEQTGVTNLIKLLQQFTSSCPQSKIALMGFSQGAHIIMDTLCGTSEIPFPFSDPYSDTLNSQLSSVAVFGDPSHLPNEPYNRGNGTRDGTFPRLKPEGCDCFASKIRSYCNDGDPFCDLGLDIDAHVDQAYDRSSGDAAVQWVVSNFNGAPSGRR